MPNKEPKTKGGEAKPYEAQGKAIAAARDAQEFKSVRAAVDALNKELKAPEDEPIVSVGRFQNWEYGKNKPNVDMFAALDKVLAIDSSTSGRAGLALVGGCARELPPVDHTEAQHLIPTNRGPMTGAGIVDHLTYCSYAHQRDESPDR
jgi:hypothetical protein